MVSPWTARIARRSEERRWYLDHYLPLRITAIHEFHSSLVGVFAALKNAQAVVEVFKKVGDSARVDDYFIKYREAFVEQIGISYGPFDAALSKAWIFLDQRSRDSVDDLDTKVNTLRLQVFFALEGKVPPKDIALPADIDWASFEEAYKRVQAELGRLLNPADLIAQTSTKLSQEFRRQG